MAAHPQPPKYDIQSKLKEMDSVPLFMKSMPDDPDQPNDAVDALQALVHEGTPDGKIHCKETDNLFSRVDAKGRNRK